MKYKKILVTGVSGTGKSTVHRELEKRGVTTIGISESGLCRWDNRSTGATLIKKADFTEEFLANHDWMCDVTLLKDLISKSEEPVVVCGSADNISECMKLCDVTLLLTCSPETSNDRIQARTDNDYGKSEAAQHSLLGYYQAYNQECLDAGAITINAEASIDEVVESVLTYRQ